MASQITSSGYITRDSIQLFYEREQNNASQSILFVHGLGGTTNSFQTLVPDLRDFDVVRFDLSGHGRSSLPSVSSIDSFVADCEGLKNVIVAGHSLGGLITLHLAAKRPNVVKAVVALAPGLPPPEAAKKALATRSSVVREKGMEAVADTVISNAFSAKSLASRRGEVSLAREMLTRQNPEGYAQAVDALAQSSVPAWGQIKGRVIVVSGEVDKVSTVEAGASIAGGIGSHAKQVVCKDTGHWPMLENPEECISAIAWAAERSAN
ncbi:hypothetical protein M426DRAFT_22375 [Hypoxylon sp. CI-4A]|nr:hypothetical protein M426DRAFT_22375 [Hypoxylon sp. CI-4A]